MFLLECKCQRNANLAVGGRLGISSKSIALQSPLHFHFQTVPAVPYYNFRSFGVTLNTHASLCFHEELLNVLQILETSGNDFSVGSDHPTQFIVKVSLCDIR